MSIFKIFKILPYALLLVVLTSCASKQPIVKEETEIVQQPKILFLNYKIVKQPSGEKSITLINQIKTEGKLKGKPKNVLNTTINDLEYIILDIDFNEVEKYALKNPLKKIVEFVNDFGNFEKKILDLDSVQFNLRLQLPDKAKHVIISELTPTGTKKHITTEIK